MSELREDLELDNYTLIVLDSTSGQVLTEESILFNPYHLDISSFLPDNGNLNLTQLYELIAQIVENKQDRENIKASKRIQVVKEWPPENLEDFPSGEVITIKLIEREPARMDQKGTGRQQRGNNFSYMYKSPEYPSNVIVVESAPYDNIIEISCWGKTSTLADSRAIWLEKLLKESGWALKVKGVDRWFFQKRLADTVIKSGEHRLHQRPLRFFVRLTEFESVIESEIRQMVFKTGIQ